MTSEASRELGISRLSWCRDERESVDRADPSLAVGPIAVLVQVQGVRTNMPGHTSSPQYYHLFFMHVDNFMSNDTHIKL
jgi:hypothetical protein